jgi:hypothetical protein
LVTLLPDVGALQTALEGADAALTVDEAKSPSEWSGEVFQAWCEASDALRDAINSHR